MLESDVFKRKTANAEIISDSKYNLLIGMVLCWGFFVNWLLVLNVDPVFLRSINIWVFLIGYFASCFFGVYLFNKSDKPSISFIGYNFVVVPFGLVVNMVVSQYDTEIVIDAIKITGGVTIVMMILGSMFPAFFKKIIGALTIALLAVIIIELFQVFVLRIHHNWIDWAVAAIFCGYIGYDWGRANQIPKTVDNAVDSAAALYMDIINLFLRILRILGRRR
jgi:FtsH-binding integral membrane protein